jgi:hypothetical protein
MGLSIEQMRAGGGSRRGTDALELCLAQHLVARVKALQFERQSVAVQSARFDGEPDPNQKLGGVPSRLGEIDAELEGEDANGRPVLSPIDQTVTWGWCDSSALLDRLGKYAVAWNGEPLKPGEWDWIVDNAVPGDLKEACQRVVALHENVGERAPK